MNENLDLCKILAGCPKGTPIYSMAHGWVKLHDVENEMIAVYFGEGSTIVYFSSNGHLGNNTDGECLLWPSEDCRDWSQFKQPQQTQFSKGDHILFRNPAGNVFLGVFEKYVDDGRCSVTIFGDGLNISEWELTKKDLTKLEKYDPKLLKTADAVLVRDSDNNEWSYSLFSHVVKRESGYYFGASCTFWKMCVPYNQETEHLVGTYDGAPKFYNLTEK